MEAVEKIREIEETIAELKKFDNYLHKPIGRLRRLRDEVSESIDFLKKTGRKVKCADKKKLELTVALVSGMDTTDLKILDKYFKSLIEGLDETKREVEENWAQIKDLGATKIPSASEAEKENG